MSEPEEALLRSERSCWRRRRTKLVVSVSAVVIVIILVIVVAVRRNTPTPSPGEALTADQFSDRVVEGMPAIFDTLAKFLAIAYLPQNNGSRAVALGYNQSAETVIATLQAAGYTVERQYLEVPIWNEFSRPSLVQQFPDGTLNVSYIHGPDYMGTRYGGDCPTGCSIAGQVVNVPNFGCNTGDYNVAELQGQIAVITTGGGCTYFDKAMLCEAAKCAAVLFRVPSGALPSGRVRKIGWLAGDPITTIPCLEITQTVANMMLAINGSVALRVHGQTRMETTFNVLTKSAEGNSNRTIISGSHLDSVPEGPGINDNGSGSAMNLHLAVMFAQLAKAQSAPLNRVIFAWWAAEEIGLLGSYHFVNELNGTGKHGDERIAIALNFDMMASPNGNRQVHNGTQTPAGTSPEVVEKSNRVTSLFVDHFTKRNRTWVSDPMTGGSDYLPFIVGGIPAGGLATGASGIKTMPQRTTFGGLANAQLDPCYHISCDTTENLGNIYVDNVRAASTVLWTLARDPHLMD